MKRLVEHRRDFGPKAPITEALIDIQVVNPDNLDLQSLKEFASAFPTRFPTSRLQTQFESQFRVQGGLEGPSVGFQHGVRGFAFFSPDKDRVIQARRDGFTFSKLHPYESWMNLRQEAKELWEHYRSVACPVVVKRLAVRYINRIPLPEQLQLQDWFNLHPTTPDPLGPMEEFLVRTVWRHQENPDFRAVATQATQPTGPGGDASIVLDIDVFTATEESFDEDSIWTTLDDLREYKNDVFFSTITEHTERSLLS
jgi:uncharacterized protein (TIGR04255 family)